MDKIQQLSEFTESLLHHYFTSLKEIGNRPYHVSAVLTPYDKFQELKKKKDIKDTIQQSKLLIESFYSEHESHTGIFWDYVKELNIQEIEAKKILEEKFIQFQNEAWYTIKVLKRRAEDRLDAFELLEIKQEAFLKKQLQNLQKLTFEQLRDSWVLNESPF